MLSNFADIFCSNYSTGYNSNREYVMMPHVEGFPKSGHILLVTFATQLLLNCFACY